MCGIVGQIGPQACDEQKLLRMMGMLTHRGPDESGLLLADGVSFGHLRLSIVDLQLGQQPMSSHDGRHWIVFNGEIFNYPELKRELEGLGHRFVTESDTEVLINAYREWGPDCLHRLNGQWAFALWDRDDHSFFLARDRWGVRPLFYTLLADDQTLIFASELKAILADERVPRVWDLESLRDIFICWVTEANRTPLKSVHQLPPGSFARIRDGRFKIHPWWQFDHSPDYVDWDRPLESWCEELHSTLSDACRVRLRADVTVGAYLSGGLDSSIVTSLARNSHRGELRTFSISFTDAVFDESDYQMLMVRHLGTDHRQLQVSPDSIGADFERTIWHAETPIHRTAPAPMLRLSGLVHDSGLKVVLTGEGADELFGGYDQFKEDRIRRFWSRSPNSAWRKSLLDRLDFQVPKATPRGRAFWYAFYQRDLEQTQRAGYSHHVRWHNGMSLVPLLNMSQAEGSSNGDLVAPLLSDDEWIEALESLVPKGFDRWYPLSKAQYWESRQVLSGYLLSSQGDRVAMANSVEGRYPFLDVNVYNLTRRMPPDLKLRVLTEKYILKKTFQQDLPSWLLSRRKQPYRSPETVALLRPPLQERLMDSLSAQAVRRRGLFAPEGISKLLSRVQRSAEPSTRDNMAMVLAYSSHIFHDLFVEAPMTPLPLPPLRTRVTLTQSLVGKAS
jgi:asparagine synthase (glutamine-hydrolysing)